MGVSRRREQCCAMGPKRRARCVVERDIPDRLFPEVVLDTEVGLVVVERAPAPVCTTESDATELQLQAEQPVGLMLAAAVGQPGSAPEQVNLRVDFVGGQEL